MSDQLSYRDGTLAGFKGRTEQARRNSQDAAAEVTQTIGRRHQQMLAAWTPYGANGAIPEQIAGDLDVPLLCVRPRAGELVRRGLLYEVGKRMGGMGSRVTAYSVIKPVADNV